MQGRHEISASGISAFNYLVSLWHQALWVHRLISVQLFSHLDFSTLTSVPAWKQVLPNAACALQELKANLVCVP